MDNAREFVSHDVKQFLRAHGIRIELTAPYSSAQNGISERGNLTIMNASRAMLFAHDLPESLWPEAAAYAVYLKNRSPTRALPDMTPFEAFWGRKPNVAHLREFGVDCWVLRQDSQLHKLARKSRPCKFMGFSEESRAFRYYNPETRRVLTSRNVIFDKSAAALEGEPSVPLPTAVEGEEEQSVQPPTGASTSKSGEDTATTAPAAKPAKIKSSPSQIPVRSSARYYNKYSATGRPDYRASALGHEAAFRPLNNPSSQRAPPGWQRVVPDHSNFVDDDSGDEREYALIAANANDDPQSLAEAQARPDWPDWKDAMDREIAQLERLGTYELAPCPPDRKPIGCKWVFRLKRDSDGRIVKHKARLVAQGFSQVPGIDYIETFAPVVRLETLRTLIALGNSLRLDIQVLDIVGAYLNGRLREEIYMRQPPMYEDGSPSVCRLRRTLYGLKQSGREWNHELDGAFLAIGFTRLLSDQCVYIRTRPPKSEIVGVHVDDMLTMTSSPADTDALYDELSNHFELSRLGPVKQIVGLEVTRDTAAGTLTIRQAQYIDRILARFGMTNANPVDTPMDANKRLRAHDGPEDPELRSLYQAIVGSLMYAALGSRPDIALAVQQLSQYASNPGPDHLTAAKRVLRYLKGTRTLGLAYYTDASADRPLEPFGYSDADWPTTSTTASLFPDKSSTWAARPSSGLHASNAPSPSLQWKPSTWQPAPPLPTSRGCAPSWRSSASHPPARPRSTSTTRARSRARTRRPLTRARNISTFIIISFASASPHTRWRSSTAHPRRTSRISSRSRSHARASRL